MICVFRTHGMKEEIQRFNNEVRQYFWRNYLAHCIEGGLYMGGLAFVAADSVMPAMISLLGGSDWLISLMPVMALMGTAWPALLVAHRVEQLYWMKPFVLIISLVQRLIYLVTALALIFLSSTHPVAALMIAAFAPFVAGSIGGTVVCAWMELVARVIPSDRRASSWAIRKIITAIIGIFAGGIIKTVLDEHPGAEGFGILHLYTFAGLMCSYFVFAMIRETKPLPPHPDKPRRTFIENMKSLPGLIRTYPEFRRFLSLKLLTMGIYIPAPFLAIHALETTGRGPGFLGDLVMAQMMATIAGNILAGWLGDRFGGRILLIIARLSLIALCLGVLFAQSEAMFLALFFIFGFGLNFNEVGEATVTLEVVPEDRRPTCVSIITALAFPGVLIAALVSTLLRSLTHSIAPSALLGAVTLTASLLIALRIQKRVSQ
ncbi:MAG: MFS transporter [Kiritimatiellaceae bacterium]|nr:MFS transporter [Kiritimatiellaceae bacterium]